MPQLSLFPSQIKIISSDKKNIVAILPRGYGKSLVLAFWCIKKLLDGCNTGLLIAPSYQQLRETTKYILKHCEDLGLDYEMNKRPKFCTSYLSDHDNIFSLNCLDGKHHYIKIASGENYETIRGSSVEFCAFDESALLREEVLDTVLPCLRSKGVDFNYQCLFCTTPRDTSNWVYKRYIESDNPNIEVIRAPATENWIEWNEEKINYFKSIMTERMYRREILAEFIDFNSNQIFYAFDKHHITTADKRGKLFLSCDQNNIPLVSIVGYVDGENHYVDSEIVIQEEANVNKVAAEFHKRYSSTGIKTVYVTGDRTGNNRSVLSTESYYEQLFKRLRELGWTVKDETLNKNPSQFESAEMCNRLFEQDKIKINADCKLLIEDSKQCRWCENKMEIDKKFRQSDALDCLRYLVYANRSKPQMRTINIPMGF